MPGLTGFITRNKNPENRDLLRQMLESVTHEPFDTSGSYVNESLGVYVGWVCHQDSFTDCLPIWNEKRDKVLFFYGEDFQDRETIERLEHNGHDFAKANASYLIHAYEESGRDFFQNLNGFFNGIMIDLRSGEIALFNDRFGMQRVYYHQDRDHFYFSSEAKAILRIRPKLRELVPESLAEFSSMGCVLGWKTLFADIHQLPCASLWLFRGGASVKRETYFNPAGWEGQPPLDKEGYYTELKKTFIRILPRYTLARNRSAMSLTGGLDTRMIMAYSQHPPGTFPCYTFGSMYRDNFDVKVARRVARACRQEHITLTAGRDIFRNFDHLAGKAVFITDGCLDATGAVELYVNAIAREVAPIRITGNYGSEVLRGIRSFKPASPGLSLFSDDFLKFFSKAVSSYYEASARRPDLSFALFQQAPWFHYSRLSLEQSQITVRSPFMDNDLLAVAYRAPREAMLSDEISHRLISEGSHNLQTIMTDRGVQMDSTTFGSRTRAGAYELLRLLEYGYDYGMPQWFAPFDFVLRSLHPERFFLGRHKFYHFRTWYRDELADYVKRLLLDERTLRRPFFNRRGIERMVKGHTSGYRNCTVEITRLLTIELIYRLLVEQ